MTGGTRGGFLVGIGKPFRRVERAGTFHGGCIRRRCACLNWRCRLQDREAIIAVKLTEVGRCAEQLQLSRRAEVGDGLCEAFDDVARDRPGADFAIGTRDLEQVVFGSLREGAAGVGL